MSIHATSHKMGKDISEGTLILGQQADTVDNLVHAMQIPGITDKIHMEALREELPDILKALRQSFVLITGDNPWE